MVESAKKWFETQQNQTQNNSPLARGISQTPLSKNVKWASARSYRHIGKDVVEVDVELTKNGKQIALNISKSENAEKNNFYTGIARLVMYKQRDGISFNTYLMVAVGKESYYAKHPNRMALNQQNAWDNDFSGWVLFFDWNENFVNGYELEEGRITLVSQKAKTNSLARTESNPPQDGCHQVWVHLGWDCYFPNPDDPIYTPPPSQTPPTLPPPTVPPSGDPTIAARQMVCDEIGYWYTECWTIPPPNNGGSGGSGAGGTNPPPSTPPPYVPPLYPTPDMDCQGCLEEFRDNPSVCDEICNSDPNSSDEDFSYDTYNGVKIHGSISQNAQVLSTTMKIIDNSVVREEVIEGYVSGGIFSPKLKIKMVSLGNNGPVAKTVDNVITLNADRIDNLTEIELAMVLIHEMIHARWKLSFPLHPHLHPELMMHYQMYPPSDFYGDHDFPQHNAMADLFLDIAVRALWEFDTINAENPQITYEHYKALFLSSLIFGTDNNGNAILLTIREWELLGEKTQNRYKHLRTQLINTY